MDAKQAREALAQFVLWGLLLCITGGSIAIGTRPHVGRDGLYSGDETGFWFGVILFCMGALALLVPAVAWANRLSRAAWPERDLVRREEADTP